jgi:hypothetical protein
MKARAERLDAETQSAPAPTGALGSGRKGARGVCGAGERIRGGAMPAAWTEQTADLCAPHKIGDRVESRSRGAMVSARKPSEPDSLVRIGQFRRHVFRGMHRAKSSQIS